MAPSYTFSLKGRGTTTSSMVASPSIQNGSQVLDVEVADDQAGVQRPAPESGAPERAQAARKDGGVRVRNLQTLQTWCSRSQVQEVTVSPVRNPWGDQWSLPGGVYLVAMSQPAERPAPAAHVHLRRVSL